VYPMPVAMPAEDICHFLFLPVSLILLSVIAVFVVAVVFIIQKEKFVVIHVIRVAGECPIFIMICYQSNSLIFKTDQCHCMF
jgi:hypothetical protein